MRAFYTGWYKELVTELPKIEDGYIHPMEGPGLGMKLLPDIVKRKDAHIRSDGRGLIVDLAVSRSGGLWARHVSPWE